MREKQRNERRTIELVIVSSELDESKIEQQTTLKCIVLFIPSCLTHRHTVCLAQINAKNTQAEE